MGEYLGHMQFISMGMQMLLLIVKSAVKSIKSNAEYNNFQINGYKTAEKKVNPFVLTCAISFKHRFGEKIYQRARAPKSQYQYLKT